MGKKSFFDNIKDTFNKLVDEDNLKKSFKHSDFFHAVSRGKIDKVQEMLRAGQDVNAYNITRKTALHIAISKRDEEMVELLLKWGADPYKPADDLSKTTPIDLVIRRKRATMLKLMQKYKVDFDHLDVKGENAIYKAIDGNKLEMVECLLRWGVDPLYTGEGKMSPVELAFRRGNMDILKLLISNEKVASNINYPTNFGMSDDLLLKQILDYGTVDVIPLLLKYGGELNSYNLNGQTTLHEAIERGDIQTASILIEYGADLNNSPRLTDGYLPLHVACDIWKWQENKTADILRLLLFAGAEPNIAEGKLKTTPLNILLKNDKLDNILDCVGILLEYGAKTNIYDKDGKTPLLYAMSSSRSNKYEIAKKLLDAGANPNLVDKNTGQSPMHMAIELRDKKLMELFFKYGANIDLKDKSGISPKLLAQQKDLQNQMLYIIKNNKKISQQRRGGGNKPKF